MNRRFQTVFPLVAMLGLAAVGCGDDEEMDLPEVDCESATVPTYSDVEAFNTCTACHNSANTGDARNDAPESINFDSYDAATENADLAAHEVYEGEMPPEDSGQTLTEAQKQELYLWALCGVPQ